MKNLARSILFLFLVPFNAYSQQESIDGGADLNPSPSNYSCGIETQAGLSFKYCFHQGDRQSTRDIVYFFHGLEGNEKTWFTQKMGTAVLERIWHKNGYDPSIVTVSFGDVWLLVNNSRFKLLPFFQQIVMPFLENKIGYQGKGRRLLIGQSMGGLNAAMASLRLQGTFSKVALLCPAITSVGPYSSPHEIDHYIFTTGADPEHVELMLKLSKGFFINTADWNQHDPLKLIPKVKVKPRFFISTGVVDEYGFDVGSEIFTRLSRRYGFKTWFVPAPGAHCDFDRSSTAKFIMEGAFK